MCVVEWVKSKQTQSDRVQFNHFEFKIKRNPIFYLISE